MSKVTYFIQGGHFNTFGCTAEPTGKWYTVTSTNGCTLYLEFKSIITRYEVVSSHWWDIFNIHTKYEKLETETKLFVGENDVEWYITSDIQECCNEQ